MSEQKNDEKLEENFEENLKLMDDVFGSDDEAEESENDDPELSGKQLKKAKQNLKMKLNPPKERKKYELLENGRYKCIFCEKDYKTEQTLTTHQNKAHSGESLPAMEDEENSDEEFDGDEAGVLDEKKIEIVKNFTMNLFLQANQEMEDQFDNIVGLTELLEEHREIYEELIVEILEDDEDIIDVINEYITPKVQFVIQYGLDLWKKVNW